jgi:hypothetical protein
MYAQDEHSPLRRRDLPLLLQYYRSTESIKKKTATSRRQAMSKNSCHSLKILNSRSIIIQTNSCRNKQPYDDHFKLQLIIKAAWRGEISAITKAHFATSHQNSPHTLA